MKHTGLNQLLCAAVINNRFCEALLRDPAQALTAGFQGQTFSLTPEERALVVDIRAGQLEDFAAQVYCWISGNGNGKVRMASGHGYKDNGWTGNGHGRIGSNGNGRNGHKHNPLSSAEPLVDLVRVPVPA
jgi:hypothetical protein